MPSKDTYSTITLAAAVLLFGGSLYLYMACAEHMSTDPSVCDNSGRFGTAMENDNCIAIDKTTAQGLFDNYQAASGIAAPYGAWIGKDLIDLAFTKNDSNGIFIFLGKDATSGETCFMLTTGKTNYRTAAIGSDVNTYFKLDAMCPAICNGLTSR